MYTAYVGVIARNLLFIALSGFLFFRTPWCILWLGPYLIVRLHRDRKGAEEKRRRLLASQFRDGMQCLLSSLEAGYSIENSVEAAVSDLRVMFDEKAPIVAAFRRMSYRLKNGEDPETVIREFGEHSGVEDIRNFSVVFTIANRAGGDIVHVIRSVNDTLYQKQEVMREIQTVLLAKQLEVNIMRWMPFAILAYFGLFAPSFLEPLYSGITGQIIMLVIYIGYLFCCRYAETIADINI
ncbi:MAG: type II secretion system F family protein [Lachnospiraceae bacterium]|nr:type II secretion system F family protein [Lachnospiraceae bacterium]